MNVSIVSEPDGYSASVTSGGRLNTAGVEADYSVIRTFVAVPVASGTLAAARAGRRGLWVQNQGANPIYLRFEAQAATAQDWLVPAGGEFRAESFPYEGEIRAIAVGGISNTLVLEMA